MDDLALRYASEKGHIETVKLLLDHGADVHVDNDRALRCASDNGHTETVKVLLDHGADAEVLK
jgi:ankyrin repeat protein